MNKIILAVILLLFVVGCTPQTSTVCLETNCFEVELAVTQEQRAQGLMYVEHMDEDKGMLFIFDELGDYPFWMKNTLIPLDIIWIDENKEVLFIGKDIRPCKEVICPSINPRQPAKYVLELNAHTADRIGLEEGNKLKFNLEGKELNSPISMS